MAIFLAINLLRSSGIVDFVIDIISPILKVLNIPEEIMPLAILRPISGSASMGIATNIMQENGVDTVEANILLGHQADERDYGVGAQILRSIGVTQMRLLTNNPVKRVGLESYGLSIVENVPIEITPNKYNERYLKTKKDRMGHTLHFNK